MFQFLFKYPYAAFSRGELVLLGTAPRWWLALLILISAAVLGLILWTRRSRSVDGMRGWRLGAIWGLEVATVAVLWFLLWRPALAVTELKPRQNIVAILVDDSRSMGLEENGSTREQRAVSALQTGVLHREPRAGE